MYFQQLEVVAAVLCDKLLGYAYIYIVFLCLIFNFICIILLFSVRNL